MIRSYFAQATELPRDSQPKRFTTAIGAMSANGVARRSGLQGDGDTPPGWLGNLIRDARSSTAQLWGNTHIDDASANRAAEWVVQQDDLMQGYVFLIILRFRPQYMAQVELAYTRILRVGRNAARRIRTNNNRSVIITRRGVVIG